MKIISLVVLGLSCVMTGQYISYRLSRRVRILEKLLLMFTMTENEISYLSRPTAELIEKLSEKEELKELDFLSECLSLYKDCGDIERAWIASVSESRCVDLSDSGILFSFGENLGKSDEEGQRSNCRYHAELAKEKLRLAREKRDKYSSLSCGLGAMTGIGLFIILF